MLLSIQPPFYPQSCGDEAGTLHVSALSKCLLSHFSRIRNTGLSNPISVLAVFILASARRGSLEGECRSEGNRIMLHPVYLLWALYLLVVLVSIIPASAVTSSASFPSLSWVRLQFFITPEALSSCLLSDTSGPFSGILVLGQSSETSTSMIPPHCLNFQLHEAVLIPLLSLFSHFRILAALSLGFPGGSVVKNLPAKQGTQIWSLRWENPLEKEMATHSSILTWRIP